MRRSKLKIALAATPAALGMFALTLGARPVQSGTPGQSYEAGDFGRLEIVGACKMSAEAIDCWNANGKRDRELSKQIEAFYTVNTKAHLEFKYGRKNRLLVVRMTPKLNANVTKNGMPQCEGKPLNLAGQIGRFVQGRGPAIEWYAIDSDPAAKSTSLTFSLNVFQGESTVTPKLDADAQIGQMKVHVDSVGPGSEMRTFDGTLAKGRPTWNVAVSFSDLPPGPVPNLFARAVNKQGATIEHVDDNGAPLPPDSRSGSNQAFSYFSAGNGTNHQVIMTTVDPSKLGGLAITASGRRSVTLGGILLDPR